MRYFHCFYNAVVNKYLVTLAISLISCMVYAQKPRQAYCEITVWTQKRVMFHTAVSFDFGMQTYTTAMLYDSKDQPLKFISNMDAVNYLSKRGWKLNSTYYNSIAGNEAVHYVMEKVITDDKQVTEGLIMKQIKLDEFYKMFSLPNPSQN